MDIKITKETGFYDVSVNGEKVIAGDTKTNMMLRLAEIIKAWFK